MTPKLPVQPGNEGLKVKFPPALPGSCSYISSCLIWGTFQVILLPLSSSDTHHVWPQFHGFIEPLMVVELMQQQHELRLKRRKAQSENQSISLWEAPDSPGWVAHRWTASWPGERIMKGNTEVKFNSVNMSLWRVSCFRAVKTLPPVSEPGLKILWKSFYHPLICVFMMKKNRISCWFHLTGKPIWINESVLIHYSQKHNIFVSCVFCHM